MTKLYDCFCMFNELDLIELRLNELDAVVDYFVIHESIKTHTGKPKELLFNKYKNRFKKFENKIIYHAVDYTPDYYLNLNNPKDDIERQVFEKIERDTFYPKSHEAYCRDAYEKENILRSLQNLNDDDIIMFSDADEIPNIEVVKSIKENFQKNEIYNLEQKHFWFYTNCLREDKWVGNTLLNIDNFKKHSVCSLRKDRLGKSIPNGGWHFSFMGGGERVKEKIQNYGEQSINVPYVTEQPEAFIQSCIDNNHDFYMRPTNFKIIPVNYENHPKYLVDNQDEFKKYIRS